MREPISNRDDLQLKYDILEFAHREGLSIHPAKDLDGFCRNAVGVGHCPCKDIELYCPCDDALERCKEVGYCTCRLFLRPDLYAVELEKARQHWERKRERAKGRADRQKATKGLYGN